MRGESVDYLERQVVAVGSDIEVVSVGREVLN